MWRILGEKFPDKVVKAWNDNEIRLLVLLSLFLQIVLVIAGNRRKYITHGFLKLVVWLTYQSADWVATVALGTLSRRQILKENESKFSIMALWAPFLLLHLGGPDTITAYAMADNELWLRHALGLLVQTGVAIYVFLSSWVGKSVNILALLMFLPGLIKYGERTWALYSASRGRFRKSMITDPDPGPNYAKFMGEYAARKAEGYRISLGKAVDTPQAAHPPPTADTQIIPEAETLNYAFYFFKTFKKLFADLILSFQDKEDSQTFFTKDSMTWDKAFAIIEVELGLIYDLFYTKVPLIYSSLGFCLRILSLSSILSILIAFLIIYKNQYPTPEIIITYFLSGGAVFLEIYAILIAASSDRMMVLLVDSTRISFLRYVKFILVSILAYILQTFLPVLFAGATFSLPSITDLPQSHEPEAPWFPRFVYKMGSFFRIFHAVPAKKRWSNTMGQYNFFSVSLNEKPPWYYTLQKRFGILELLEKYRYSYNVNVPNGLKAIMFRHLKERLYSSRGDQSVLKQLNCFDENEEVEFDQSLLIWHIATELCYYKDFPEKSKLDKRSKHELRQWIYNYKVNEDSRTATSSSSSAQQQQQQQQQQEQEMKFKSEISKWLSEYMLYLLICCPFMLPSGLGQTRYQDTLAEIHEFIEEHKSISISSEGRKEASIRLLNVNTHVRPSEVKGDRSKTVLFDGCRLAKALQNMGSSKWETIIRVWLNLLSYAAAQCRWNDHAEQLREGGQFITHVWLLMAHLGMTDQYQISRGHVVAKWQVN